MNAQHKMNSAMNNYLQVAEILSNDLMTILEQETECETWKRTYIRHVSAMIEGDSYCFQQMAVIGLEVESPSLTSKEEKALKSSISFSASDQIKYVLRAAYKMFDLGDPPDFSGREWELAKEFFLKRHKLMHPKKLEDIRISGEEWEKLHDGSKWLVAEHFNIVSRLYERYAKH